MIKNTTTTECYIGSTAVLRNRVNAHRCQLLNNKHTNVRLQRSFNKYGGSSFVFGVIELCAIRDLLTTETLMISKYKAVFNLRTVTENNRGISLSKETRKKMSLAKRGKPPHPNATLALIERNKQRAGNLTDKMKEALKLGPRACVGKAKSPKTRLLISKAKAGKKYNKSTGRYCAGS